MKTEKEKNSRPLRDFNTFFSQWISILVILLTLGTASHPASAQWKISPSKDGWSLLRDGKPFYIQGAVAPDRFDILRACGGNAVRSGSSQKSLDAAHAEGLVVLAGLPVRAERDGMDWNDPKMVAEQRERVLERVRELKDHPALMFWALGNELDHIPGKPAGSYNPQLWKNLNDLAIAVRQIDPLHPVMTVVGTGDSFDKKLQLIAKECKDMDMLGINTYGDIVQVTQLAHKFWPKPYAITEWGPTGHWQVSKSEWGVSMEETSSEKAQAIAERYEKAILADRSHCLGSFIFFWSERQERTHTWYGLFCNGLKTESIDVMCHFWKGEWPENRAPAVKSIGIEESGDPKSTKLITGQVYHAGLSVTDPESDALVITWDIRPEVVIPKGSYAGGLEKRVQPIPGLIRDPGARRIEFTAPAEPGPYRLFVTATDGKGNIAYGNIPFLTVK